MVKKCNQSEIKTNHQDLVHIDFFSNSNDVKRNTAKSAGQGANLRCSHCSFCR